MNGVQDIIIYPRLISLLIPCYINITFVGNFNPVNIIKYVLKLWRAYSFKLLLFRDLWHFIRALLIPYTMKPVCRILHVSDTIIWSITVWLCSVILVRTLINWVGPCVLRPRSHLAFFVMGISWADRYKKKKLAAFFVLKAPRAFLLSPSNEPRLPTVLLQNGKKQAIGTCIGPSWRRGEACTYTFVVARYHSGKAAARCLP